MSSEPGQVQALCREQGSDTCYDKMEGKTGRAHLLWGLFIMSSPESFAGGKIRRLIGPVRFQVPGAAAVLFLPKYANSVPEYLSVDV